MTEPPTPGPIVVLNGAPRSGKSTIVQAMLERLDGHWVNLGVDVSRRTLPPHLQPGIGLRPGEPDHPAAPHVARLYAALYDTIAAHSRQGLGVAVDVGHHDPELLASCARRLAGLRAWLVGVRCPVEVIMERRRASGLVPAGPHQDGVPAPVRLWQERVHVPGVYDLELDTSQMTAAACVAAIAAMLAAGRPHAFGHLAAM